VRSLSAVADALLFYPVGLAMDRLRREWTGGMAHWLTLGAARSVTAGIGLLACWSWPMPFASRSAASARARDEYLSMPTAPGGRLRSGWRRAAFDRNFGAIAGNGRARTTDQERAPGTRTCSEAQIRAS
jgi:hypothetical protein